MKYESTLGSIKIKISNVKVTNLQFWKSKQGFPTKSMSDNAFPAMCRITAMSKNNLAPNINNDEDEKP